MVHLFACVVFCSSNCNSVKGKLNFPFVVSRIFFHLLCNFITATHVYPYLVSTISKSIHKSLEFSRFGKMTATWNHRPDNRLRRHYILSGRRKCTCSHVLTLPPKHGVHRISLSTDDLVPYDSDMKRYVIISFPFRQDIIHIVISFYVLSHYLSQLCIIKILF